MNEDPKNAKKTPRKPPKTSKTTSGEPRTESASCWFCAVVQADYPSQMDVLRWIEQDATYTLIYILHDKDTYTEQEIEDHAEKDEKGRSLHYITRKNGDGTSSQYRAGDVKPAHYHALIGVSHKMRASTLYKRFCNQLYFALPQKDFGDRVEACRYLTHEAFRARDKYKYPRSDICYSKVREDESKQIYMEMMVSEGVALLDTVRTVKTCKDSARADGADDTQAIRKAVSALLDSGDIAGIKAVMSRAYFFDKLL